MFDVRGKGSIVMLVTLFSSLMPSPKASAKNPAASNKQDFRRPLLSGSELEAFREAVEDVERVHRGEDVATRDEPRGEEVPGDEVARDGRESRNLPLAKVMVLCCFL